MSIEPAAPLLCVRQLQKVYRGANRQQIPALRAASFALCPGQTIGILGDSGSGKSTLGQIIAGLFAPTSGEIFYQGQSIRYPFRGNVRREIQILFQHPEVSFNPRLCLETSLREPYRLTGQAYSRARLLEHLAPFGLYEEHLKRLPGTLSGGELQRAALARILTVQPRLIVLDEPTSMLDVISQAQMIQLLRQIQRQQQTAYLFITHDVALCRAFADQIYHMEDGVLHTDGEREEVSCQNR